MSYDISFRCSHCHDNQGRFHNYTYNLGPMFRWALGGDGINDLDGKTAAEVIPMLRKAIAKCEDDKDLSRFDAPNGWGSGRGGLDFLRDILADAVAVMPDSVVRVS